MIDHNTPDPIPGLAGWWRTCKHHFFTHGPCGSCNITRTAAIQVGWRPKPCRHTRVNDYICLDCGQSTIELAFAGKLP